MATLGAARIYLQVLKPLLFPMLEAQTPGAALRKLDALLPRTQMSPAEALRALVRREYGKISAWVRATAVTCLGQPGAESLAVWAVAGS